MMESQNTKFVVWVCYNYEYGLSKLFIDLTYTYFNRFLVTKCINTCIKKAIAEILFHGQIYYYETIRDGLNRLKYQSCKLYMSF